MGWTVLSDSSELLTECASLAQSLRLAIEPSLVPSPWQKPKHTDSASRICMLTTTLPGRGELADWLKAAMESGRTFSLGLINPDAMVTQYVSVARDEGIYADNDVGSLLSQMALIGCDAHEPWRGSVRHLSATDKARMAPALEQTEHHGGFWKRLDSTIMGWTKRAEDSATPVGILPNVMSATIAMRETESDRSKIRAPSQSAGTEKQAALETVYGPKRRLSDPASKAALFPYGLPLPKEELCSSPSRTASEATRMGFPVRISIASPDVRVWEHPELETDWIENPTQAKDMYRELTQLAQAVAPTARVLGVTVAPATRTIAKLRVVATPVSKNHTWITLGFADAYGQAIHDETALLAPCTHNTVLRALKRLRGFHLLESEAFKTRDEGVQHIADAVSRLARFSVELREEVLFTELNPICLTATGHAEVQQACVAVSDMFEKLL